MSQSSRQSEKLIVLLLFGIIALNYPILTLFNKNSFLLGIPTLYSFLFLFWAVFIGLMAIIMESGKKSTSKPPPTSTGSQEEA